MKVTRLLITILIAVSLASCVTNEKLTYMQYETNSGKMPEQSVYKLMPYDNIFIRVVTPDPQWSAMFNTMPVTTTSITVTEQSADLVSYVVDGEGYIELPYAGTVKMVNNYVSLLGEFQRPGRYPIYKDRLNIFQAIAMAGDLTNFGNRKKLQMIRQTPSGNIVKEFSLLDRSILSSEYFYVMPNDVIYSQPIKGKFFRLDAFPYTVILSTITTFLLIWSVLK